MKTAIATGVPHSDWEKTLPILQQAGLELAGDTFARWEDGVLMPIGKADPPQVNYPLQPEHKLHDSLDTVVPDNSTAPLLLADSRNLWLLDFWAAKLPQAQFLLFYARAETALAHACIQGIEPQQFLESWQAAIHHLLKFKRHHRRRTLLFDAEAVCRHPQAFIDVCQRNGLSLQSLPQKPVPAPDRTSVELFLAHHLVAAHPNIQAIQAELEASSHPLGDAPSIEIQPLTVFNKQRQRILHERKLQQEIIEADKKLQIAEQTKAEHESERYQLQQQAEQIVIESETQAKLNVELQDRLAQAQQINQNLETSHEQAALEIEQVLLELQEVKTELETTFLQKQLLEQALTDEATQRQHLLDQIEDQAKLSAERQAQLDQAQKEHQTQRRQLQAQIEQLASALEEQKKTSAERQAQIEQAQKDHATQCDKFQAQINELTNARDKQSKLSSERQAKLEQIQQAHQKLEADQQEATQENELLLLQLHQVQEELEATFLEKQNYEQKFKDQGTQQQQLQAQIDHLTKARDEQAKLSADRQSQIEKFKKDQTTERQQLKTQTDQLAQANNAQAKMAADHQAHIAKIQKEHDNQRQQMQAQIKQLTQAKDEQTKIIAVEQKNLEQERQRYQKLEAVQNESVQENELLLLQLHQVQEELEETFFRNQNLKQAQQKLEADNKQAISENEKLLQELSQFRKELLDKESELEKQYQRVARLKKTVSWKITAPVRVIAKPFKRSRKEKEKIKEQVNLLKNSGLFDTEWYLSEYKDVATKGEDPVEHYIRHGAAEGRNPSPAFNPNRYLEINPDVAAEGINPFIHFVKYGKAEGRVVSLEN